MQGQQAAQRLSSRSAYQTGSIVLPEKFNARSGNIIVSPKSDILIPEEDGYVRDANGVLHPAGQIYIPRRTYFIFNKTGNAHILPVHQSAVCVSASISVDHSEDIKAVSEDPSLNVKNPCDDHDFIMRLKEGVFSDLDRRRARLGFPTLEQAIQDLKNKRPQADQFVDDISAITRSVSGYTYRH
jgi:hypothetical protein